MGTRITCAGSAPQDTVVQGWGGGGDGLTQQGVQYLTRVGWGGADPGLIDGDPLKHQLHEGVRQELGYRDKMAAGSNRLIFSIPGGIKHVPEKRNRYRDSY